MPPPTAVPPRLPRAFGACCVDFCSAWPRNSPIDGAPALLAGAVERPSEPGARLCGAGRPCCLADLSIDFRIGVTLEETLPASLAVAEHRASLLLASGRTLGGADEAARRAASTRPCTRTCTAAWWLLTRGISGRACVMSGRGQRSAITTCLEVCHRLHYRPVLDDHADCCAPAAWSGGHVADTTMSNRIRFVVHHDANVHLAPRDRLEALEVAPLADEARLRVCALGCAVRPRCRPGGYAGGVNTAKMSLNTSRLTANLEVFTIKTDVFTNPAQFHCFPSRFDHSTCTCTCTCACTCACACDMWGAPTHVHTHEDPTMGPPISGPMGFAHTPPRLPGSLCARPLGVRGSGDAVLLVFSRKVLW